MSAISTRVSPPPLPQAPAKPGSSTRALLVTVAAMLFLTLPLMITILATPRFVEIFKDFGVALPLVARFFINFNNALSTPLGVVVAFVLVCAVLACVAGVSYRSRFGALAIFLLALTFFILYMALYVLAMYEPLVSMVQSLQTRPG